MKKFMVFMIVLFSITLLSGCEETDEMIRYIELYESNEAFDRPIVEHESRFVNIYISQDFMDEEFMHLVIISDQTEEVEVRYYCGVDDSNEPMGIISPDYSYDNKYWGLLDVEGCESNFINITVYHYEDNYNESVKYFEHKLNEIE